ncbi:copper chaperone CopZ [Limisalsivibrio acetivorans]|uniref:copper chaperone CopZ n=1 Tax=Limisalsivibrio acetivorans TaxID=1304888 RepID=UPI0003B73CA3|nr:copper chaperone CopZ [Limisalsivibrio acetivorans]
MERIDLKVSGMTCGHCKAAVEKGVGELDGVESVEVNLEKGEAAVKYDASVRSLADIKEAIEEEGYEVKD